MTAMPVILIVDDNETIREGLAHTVRKLGHEAVIASSGVAGIAAFKAKRADFVITDLKMEGGTGVDVLKTISTLDPDVPIMIITGFGTVETAVEAMKLGAFDFLTKPIQPEVVRLKVERALELCATRRGRRKADALTDVLRSDVEARFPELVGSGEKMAIVRRMVEKIAASETTVFIAGESGTGKELIARAIHRLSKRANGPFIKVNCGALTETLLESELFGHEKGAFTGAIKQKLGRFELADGGTLFLDEVGEVSAAFQSKLLRVLQEGELERVGGTRTIKVDVRVIAATHRDLEAEVEAGRFREDLYYRLNVMPIYLPALRERMEDIPDIARFLVDKIGRQQGRTLGLTEAALRVLMHHDWPGNVRELENCLERAAVLTEGDVIDRDAILLTGIDEKVSMGRGAIQAVDLDDPNLDERERVIAALEQAGWVQAKAARLLDMTPRQIAYRIQILKIKVRQI